MSSTTEWITRWKVVIARKPSRPGVWRRKEGGYFVRGRATDPRTGRMREVKWSLPDADLYEAERRLLEGLQRIRMGTETVTVTATRFKDFAISLLEQKILNGDIRSAKTRQQWGSVLKNVLFPVFGDYYMDKLQRGDVLAWKADVGRRIQNDALSVHTANHWFALLRVILNAYADEAQLPRHPLQGVTPFSTRGHFAYSDEEPNALTPAEVPVFLATMRRLYPQHFAMVSLGMVLGLRPSSLRPLRRAGTTPDVQWDSGVLLVRRSQTIGDEVMEMTKTGGRQRLTLPKELMWILHWHVDLLPEGPMRDSELLFPSETGSFRSPMVLDKPFKRVAKEMGLTRRFTPRGLRRTFQDLCRAAEVRDIVTRAVSGHATEEMQRHYSTVSGDEMRASLSRVVSLAGVNTLGSQDVAPANDAGGRPSGRRDGETKKAG